MLAVGLLLGFWASNVALTMRLVVTGATGFLGSELVPHLVGARHEVIALVREPQRYTPPQGVQVVKGDITASDLGLKANLQVDEVFHAAAMMSFKESDRAAIYAANCKGTCNVINYCLNHRVGRILYCSTVYVCGDYGRRLEWTESHYNQGQGFRNHYERSKFLAEGYLREAARGFAGTHDPMVVTVFRHSDPRGTLNLVPVDRVATEMVDLMDHDLMDHSPWTYHLVTPRPLTNAQVCFTVAKALGMREPHFSLTPPKDPLSRLYNRSCGHSFVYCCPSVHLIKG